MIEKIQNREVLWIVAILFMLVEHVGKVVYGVNYYGVTLPLVTYMLSKSVNSENGFRVAFRILVIAVIAQIGWQATYLSGYVLNDMFGMAIGVVALTLIKKREYVFTIIVLVAGVLLHHLDYMSSLSIFMILVGSQIYSKFITALFYAYLGLMVDRWIWVLAGPIMYIVENFKGFDLNVRIPKRIKYAVYPAHIIVLGAIKTIIG